MRVKQIALTDKGGVVVATISKMINQKRIQGIYDNAAQSPSDILSKRSNFNFKKEFTRYIDDNYGDVVSKGEAKKLKKLIEKQYEKGEIEDIKDLHETIELLGKERNILFD
jgi:hypothetical protein